ncbi:MAG: hypothetical protein PHZ07_00310 [Patescibacteria group bacterium]|nr:hypothetical protein [Patescibacteria group bacterium]MDD4304168.1 hypothetical protein [Patescibacteria group bacterium]MDD4695200.1 hypothetical protein [Patescibacteria group bacterium]
MKVLLYSRNEKFLTPVLKALVEKGFEVQILDSITQAHDGENIRTMFSENKANLLLIDMDSRDGKSLKMDKNLFQSAYEVFQLCRDKNLYPNMVLFSRKKGSFDFYETITHNTSMHTVEQTKNHVNKIIKEIRRWSI